MNQEELLNACDAVIRLMPTRFDSHQFIRKFIYNFPSLYGKLLIKHDNVTTAHAEIANTLKNYSVKLCIQEVNGSKDISVDIFNNLAKCAVWYKL